MLSTCFNNLFSQLQPNKLDLDALLLTWLTLNDETTQDENNQSVFDPSKIPSIPLNPTAVTSLLGALAWSPNLPIRTWVLAFRSLTILANLKYAVTDTAASGNQGGERCLATVMISDSNLMSLLIKFLSGSYSVSSTMPGQQHAEVSLCISNFKINHEMVYSKTKPTIDFNKCSYVHQKAYKIKRNLLKYL